MIINKKLLYKYDILIRKAKGLKPPRQLAALFKAGIQIKRKHQVLEFGYSRWLKSCIEFYN